MLHQTDGLSLQSPLRPLSVLVFHLLLTPSCRGQSQVIGPPHPILAAVGADIILPCQLEPAADLTAEILEWKRSDLSPRFVHVWRAGHNLENVKNPSYKGRTSVFADELKHGNISLKLSKVQPSDEGTYECNIPEWVEQSSVKLVVASDAASSLDISLLGIDRNRGGVILNCESKGWYPEPVVLWLDDEGNLLSAGPTETVRGPDGLYTVSRRVTVKKRHSNSFTCRVQQKNINQTRETHIHVPDDFFEVQSSSAVTGLTVSLAVCILLILLLVFFVWRQNKNKTKRSHRDETGEGERKNRSKTKTTEDQFFTEEDREREQLTTDEKVQMNVLNIGEREKKTKHLEDKEQAADMKWKKTNEELKEANHQLENKNAEISQLKTQLEDKEQAADMKWKKTNEELTEANRQLKNKNAEISQLKTQVGSLTEEKKGSENKCLQLQKELESKKKELESASWFSWPRRS